MTVMERGHFKVLTPEKDGMVLIRACRQAPVLTFGKFISMEEALTCNGIITGKEM